MNSSLIWLTPVVALMVSLTGTTSAAMGTAGNELTEVARIELPGVDGRLDHLAIDPERHRLYVAARAAGEVEVIDLQPGRRIASLQGQPEAQGLAFSESLHRLFVASGKSGELSAFEGDRRIQSVRGLPDADNIRLTAADGLLLLGFDDALALVDPRTLAVKAKVGLPGHPESFEAATRGAQVYVNVPDAGQIAVVDRATLKVTASWRIEPEAANFPLVLDEAGHRLYIGTRSPAKLLGFDTTNGHRVEEAPLCRDVDDLFFDARQQRLLAVCGQGVVDVLQRRDGGRFELLQRQETAAGARTGLFVPETATLYVAAPAGLLSGRAQVFVYQLR